MSSYISSNANRFYVATESSFGSASPVTADNRFPAVKLMAQQILEPGSRHDKTGSRTFLGTSKWSRRRTAYEVRTYLTSWSGAGEPGYGPLCAAAFGSPVQLSSGLAVAGVQSSLQFTTAGAHGLTVGSALSYRNEIRFAIAIPDSSTVTVNAPFTNALSAGSSLGPTATYRVATALPSVTLYDYWDPATAVDRIITGAAVDTFEVGVNGDFHEMVFRGPAADLLDTTSFTAGTAALASYPSEPPPGQFSYSIVPGHLGQVWLGNHADQFFTLTSASVDLKNNLELRSHEFGSSYPRAVVPGPRQVVTNFSLLAQDDVQTAALYQGAKQRVPISAMIQLGHRQGQLMGIYLPSVSAELPVFNDSEVRLQWDFKNSHAQGMINDEIFLAFA